MDVVVGLIRVAHWANSLIMVRKESFVYPPRLIHTVGVDACNTVLEVLLFAAATNLGQSWNTVLTLFGGEEVLNDRSRDTLMVASKLRLPSTCKRGMSIIPRL